MSFFYCMKEESIKKIRVLLIETLLNDKVIDENDKLEIELMLLHLLEPKDYEENRKALQKHYEKTKWHL